MKQLQILFFAILLLASIFIIPDYSYPATAGNPLDIDVPPNSSILRQEVVDKTLEEYEQIVKIKAALDLEFVFDKDLNTTSEVTNAELKGQWCMLKLGTTIFDRVEPYIKVGTSKLTAEWRQNGTHDIEVRADYGLAWGGGIKGIIWEFEDWGIRLTGDIQYRTTGPDAENITSTNMSVDDPVADFDIEEWQTAILLSKKFELPLKLQSIYIVPYTGATFSDSTVDVRFTNPRDSEQNWTLYKANNKNLYGFLIGCDIMPSLTSYFIYSIELRLASEFALTLGGAMKF